MIIIITITGQSWGEDVEDAGECELQTTDEKNRSGREASGTVKQ